MSARDDGQPNVHWQNNDCQKWLLAYLGTDERTIKWLLYNTKTSFFVKWFCFQYGKILFLFLDEIKSHKYTNVWGLTLFSSWVLTSFRTLLVLGLAMMTLKQSLTRSLLLTNIQFELLPQYFSYCHYHWQCILKLHISNVMVQVYIYKLEYNWKVIYISSSIKTKLHRFKNTVIFQLFISNPIQWLWL